MRLGSWGYRDFHIRKLLTGRCLVYCNLQMFFSSSFTHSIIVLFLSMLLSSSLVRMKDRACVQWLLLPWFSSKKPLYFRKAASLARRGIDPLFPSLQFYKFRITNNGVVCSAKHLDDITTGHQVRNIGLPVCLL